MTADSRNVVFMLSQPRSGSTLLQRILGSHSEVYTRSEPWILLPSLYPTERYPTRTAYDSTLCRIATADFIDNLPDGGRERYLKALRAFHMALYGSYLDAAGKSLFLDKTPRYYLIADALAELFPKAHFVLLLRNPLAVLHSIVQTWVRDEWARFPEYYHDLLTAVEVQLDILHDPDTPYRVVRYETLLESPEPTLRSLCDAIGIGFEPAMLEYYTRKTQKWTLGDPSNAHSKSGIDASHADHWTRKLTDPQMWRLTHDYLRHIGERNFTALGYDYRACMQLLDDTLPAGSLEALTAATTGLEALLGGSGRDAQWRELEFARRFNTLHLAIDRALAPLERFIVYGAGHVGNLILQKRPEAVAAFVDRSPESSIVRGDVPVLHPSRLKTLDELPVVVAVLHHTKAIRRYLVDEMGIAPSRIRLLELHL